MVGRSLLAALLALILAAVPQSVRGAGKWLRVRSSHFVFIGDAGEGSIREVAERVEAFREALRQSLPSRAAASPVPTVIFVFGSDQSFAPFKPLYQGKTVERIAGYFQGGEDANYITINVEGRDAAYPVIFHEFAHALINNTLIGVPVWVNEGLAELYRTFADRDGGRTAVIGLPPHEHVLALRQLPFMPLADLVAVGHDSAVYNEGDRRGVFYAESWALTHYLLFGNEKRSSQLAQYLQDVNQGLPALDAFQHAFGAEPRVLEKELHDYVRRFLFNAREVKFDQSFRQAIPKGAEPLQEPEAQAYLGDLLAHMNRPDEARVLFERVLKADPASPRALAAFGALHVRERRVDEALPLLERATALAPDDPSILTWLGDGLVARIQDRGSMAGPEVVDRARTVLAKAAALAPDDAHLAASRGFVEMVSGEHLGEARTFFERAVALAPARESYSLMLADVLLRQRDVAAATARLGPLVARGSRPEIKDRARELLARMAETRLAAASEQAASNPPVDAGAARSTERTQVGPVTPQASRPESSGARAAGGQPRFIPDLRPLRDGEVRVLGQFQAVECGPNGIVLTMNLGDRALRLGAARFDAVEFIAYRQDVQLKVNCGPVSPSLRALATYRPSSAAGARVSDGQAIALELIPDDYTPKR